METRCKPIIPALGFRALTPFYDPLVRLSTRYAEVTSGLLRQATVRPDERVLDVGCGTGTLLLALKRACPEAAATGLDADEVMLERAREKAQDEGLGITFDRGVSDELPYPDAAFDVALSSLVFHHLSTKAKRKSFEELFRCLAPGGRLHMADWGGARRWVDHALFLPVRLLDGFETTADNIRGRLPGLMTEAGFSDVHEASRVTTPIGVISLYRARRPATNHQGG